MVRARGWTVWVLWLLACAPDNIARSSCQSEMLAVGDPWSCTVSAAVIEQASSLSFDTESRNQVAQVEIALRVKKGALRLGYRDLAGDHQVVITPAAPLSLELQTRLHRDRRSFTLSFAPVGGKVEGLTGTVHYATR